MAKKVFAAGTGVLRAFVGTDLLFTAQTLTESTVEITSAVEEIRGGKANSLIGKYFHDPSMTITATDALFNLEFLQLAFGAEMSLSNINVLTTEPDVEITVANQITVQGTPVDFIGEGTVGWYRFPSENDWKQITFEGQTAQAAGLAVGQKVCVLYNAINNEARELIIPESIVGSEFHAELRQDLFSGEATDVSSASKVGEIVIDIPRFQMNVDQTLTMSSSGASTSNMSGNALVSYDAVGCESEGYYAKIKEVIYGRKFYEGVTDLAIAGGTLEQGDFVRVKGIKATGTVDIAPANLTYTISPEGNAVINEATGEITTVSGDCSLVVKLKDGDKTIPAPYNALEGIALIEAGE